VGNDDDLSKNAASLSKRGAKLGGTARAERMTPEERSESSRRAAEARWGSRVVLAPYVGDITLGDRTIDCAVLEDERRVINQTAMNAAFERTGGARRGPGAQGLPLLSPLNLQPFISPELRKLGASPIPYRRLDGTRSLGYPAEIVPLLCELYLAARQEGVLTENQQPIAGAAEILLRGLARVAIEALVDEATGYQDVRAKNALAAILEAFIAKELQPWVSTFPEEFYAQIFRLRQLDYPRGTVKRPQYFGNITNDIIYKRMAPGVLAELKRVADRTDSGQPRHKYFQRLTMNAGYPKLREHLGSVVTIMKLSDSWDDFMHKLERLHPRFGDTLLLPFDEPDTGVGL
jgi:P63C domain